MKQRTVALLIALVVSGFLPGSASADAPPRSAIVAVYSQEADAPFNQSFDVGLRRALELDSASTVDYYSEFLDSFRFSGPEYIALQREHLRKKYERLHVTAVVAVGVPAIDVMLSGNDRPFPQVPMVFFTGTPPVVDRETAARLTGITVGRTHERTLELALRLHPSTRQVYVVLNSPGFDQSFTNLVTEQLRGFGTVTTTYLRDLSTDDVVGRLKQAPRDSLVLYVRQAEGSNGRRLTPRDALSEISQAINLPIYGSYDGYLGSGIVGGEMVRAETVGARAAQMALQVARGRRPEDIPIERASTQPVFDWQQLRRLHIPESLLPAGSIVLFREPTFWRQHRDLLIGAIAIVVMQMVLIGGLLVQRARRRRIAEALLRSEARTSAILRVLPDLMFVMNFDGVYLDYHASDVKGLFVPPGEFIGKNMLDVMPPLLAEKFSRALAEVRLHDGPSVVEYSLPMAGEERFYEARLIRSEGDKIVSIVRDVTDRERAAAALERNKVQLRASYGQLRDLAGRLIAAQEAERKHIARELHDDLGQKLALLNIKVDQVRQNRERAGVLSGDLNEIADHAADVASTVHRLSHHLHPSILDTMGLVASIQALCRDAASEHALAIDFQHHNVPSTVRSDVALCCYRIVQEALHNVIRHSAARVAEVRIDGGRRHLNLRIADGGVGFVLASKRSRPGLGLVSMHERVNFLGGRIVVHTAPGAGTRIAVEVPLEPSQEAAPGEWRTRIRSA